jgi:RHS repeat-associated protein
VAAYIGTQGTNYYTIYDPFGQPTILASDWSTRGTSSYSWLVLFQSGRYDTAVSLYYFRNRILSPALGRWMTNDPLQFRAGDDNFYRYIGDRPINRLDPSGQCFITVHCRPTQSPVGPWVFPQETWVHCGLTITDDWVTYQLDGKGGDFTGIVTRPAPGCKVPQNIAEDPNYLPGGDFFTWGVGGTVFSQPVWQPDAKCECLREYFKKFNAAQIPYDKMGCNSNWTLYCMMKHCDLQINWLNKPPLGYQADGCCKRYAIPFAEGPAAGGRCPQRKCLEYWQCP